VLSGNSPLRSQMRSQLQEKRRIPFVASNHEMEHGRSITFMLWAIEE
jgi:hypothetical protein